MLQRVAAELRAAPPLAAPACRLSMGLGLYLIPRIAGAHCRHKGRDRAGRKCDREAVMSGYTGYSQQAYGQQQQGQYGAQVVGAAVCGRVVVGCLAFLHFHAASRPRRASDCCIAVLCVGSAPIGTPPALRCRPMTTKH